MYYILYFYYFFYLTSLLALGTSNNALIFTINLFSGSKLDLVKFQKILQNNQGKNKYEKLGTFTQI